LYGIFCRVDSDNSPVLARGRERQNWNRSGFGAAGAKVGDRVYGSAGRS